MTDLIARLRDAAIDLRDTSFAARTIREAADELERLTPWANISRTMSDWEAFDMSDRPCTCHPDDNPPVPCPQKFTLSECRAAAPAPEPPLYAAPPTVQAEPNWQSVQPRSCIKPTAEAADAFWRYWKANGETHKHGYYESTWGAINAALAHGYIAPPADDEAVSLLKEWVDPSIDGIGRTELIKQTIAYLAKVKK